MQVCDTNANAASNSDSLPIIVPSHNTHSHEMIYEKGINLQYIDDTQTKILLAKFSRNFLKIGLHNARSLPNNIDNYRTFLGKSELNILAIVESWLMWCSNVEDKPHL